jgi:ABC-2 type transport system ATP-binding protein
METNAVVRTRAPVEPRPWVLECNDLRKSFGDLVAVDGVGFRIAPGETYGLLGPNGAGKTTAISMITGLLERDRGEVVIGGQSLTTTSVRAKAAIGYVPQDLAIYPDLTGAENLRFFARLYGLAPAESKRRSDEVLDVIGLRERADERTKTYSGGMKRRLNVGIGLLHRPQLLVLDEPTVGVDPQSRNAILESVEGLSEGGMAVLYTTHYMEEAERLCDRVGIIDEGRLKAEGTRRELVGLVGERDGSGSTRPATSRQPRERAERSRPCTRRARRTVRSNWSSTTPERCSRTCSRRSRRAACGSGASR